MSSESSCQLCALRARIRSSPCSDNFGYPANHIGFVFVTASRVKVVLPLQYLQHLSALKSAFSLWPPDLAFGELWIPRDVRTIREPSIPGVLRRSGSSQPPEIRAREGREWRTVWHFSSLRSHSDSKNLAFSRGRDGIWEYLAKG